MAKYVAVPRRAWLDDDGHYSSDAPTSITIHEPATTPVDTGLLDADGNPLYRLPERNPIGFLA